MNAFRLALAAGLIAALSASPAWAACTIQPLSVGSTQSGTLASTDCVDNNANGKTYYYDIYEFTGSSGQQVLIENSAGSIDPDLLLIYPDGTTTVYNDNGGGGTAARIPANSGYLTLSQSGTYYIVASSSIAVQSGSYTLKFSDAVSQQPVTSASVVEEFYNADLNHYFITGDSGEASGIDNGAAGPGWSRTGYSMDAWQSQSAATANANAVCRFYGTPGVGPNSHFYTADAGECDAVKQDPGWFYEGIALYSQPVQYGSCPLGTTPLYRVYNNRWMYNDSNHRFVTDSIIYQQMADQGWVQEGLVMCVNGAVFPLPANATTGSVGTTGGSVTDGSTTVTIPANGVSTTTTVSIAPGTVTGNVPDGEAVSAVSQIELSGDTTQPITVQMPATAAIASKVFAVVTSDVYTMNRAAPYFRSMLYETTAAGNMLTALLPASAPGNQSALLPGQNSTRAGSAASTAKRRFTIWFITGYDVLQSTHFSIRYPVKPCNSLVIRDYLQIAEDAYSKLITDMGFSPAGLSWPMMLDVLKLDSGTYGVAGYGRIGRWISGTKSLSMAINQDYCNSSSQADMNEMKATIGHEFFHTLQYVYDPHWAVRESVFGSPFGWLMEASSTWFEAEMMNNSAYDSTVRSGNADFYRKGLEHGGSLNAQDHGYGASSFLRYLSSQYGRNLVHTVWSNVSQQATYSSTRAIEDAGVSLSPDWQHFSEQYMMGQTSFGWGTPETNSGSGFKFTYTDTTRTASFVDDLYPLSGVKISFNFNALDKDRAYTLTLTEGQNDFMRAYLFDKSASKVAEFADKYSFTATPSSGYFLLVVNSNDAYPYTTPTHVKVTLDSGPVINAISPARGPVDTAVSISGSGFGTTADTRSVTFSGLKAGSVVWKSDTEAVAKVPQNASTGDVIVEVNGAQSNGMPFEVVAQCSSTQNAGGDTPDTRTIELGKASGSFNFSYDTYWQQDQIIVRYQGATLFDTGCVGASGTKALSFNGTATEISVQVIPNCAGGSGTAWDYAVSCP